MKDRLHPFAATALGASLSVAPLTFENIPTNIDCGYENGQPNIATIAPQGPNLERFCPPIERAEGQTFGTFIYGHRERDMIMERGDIADGATPINGKEYTVADVELVFQQLRELKYANIDFGILSWHSIGDKRDKYFKFLLETLSRWDNPHPNFKVTVINEIDSNLQKIPDYLMDMNSQYKKDNYWNSPFFLKDGNGTPIEYVFSQYLEGEIDNPGHAQQWYEAGVEYEFDPYLEAYFGDTLNPFNDDLNWYQYADEIWDLRPSGLHITRDVARVNVGYSKPGDFKIIPFDKNMFRRNLIKATQSGKMVIVVSWNEYWETTNAEGNQDAQEIMHEIFPGSKHIAKDVSSDQFISSLQESIRNRKPIDVDKNLPPAQPKEHPLPVVDARRSKKEDELKPVLKPKFKTNLKVA